MADAPTYNEKELLLRIAEGDEKAFENLFYHYNQRLYPFLLKKIKQPHIAEEIVQDTFLKVWMTRERLAQMENPEGYIYRIAANLALDHFRLLAVEYRLKKMSEFVPSNNAATEVEISFRETQRIIIEAVEKLPDQRKRIYKMRQEGLSYNEIGAQLGLSVNTVKNQLINAAKFVRAHLLKRGISTVALLSFYTSL